MALVNPKTGKGWALMTNRSYFQFDTKSRLRRFFASSEGWSDRPGCRMRHRSLQSGTQFRPRAILR